MPLQDESEELLCSVQPATNVNPSVTDAPDAASNSRASPFQHALSKIQCHKWQELFDFERILRHINHAEKLFLRGNCGSITCSNNFAHQPATLNSPPRSPTTRCTRQMNQVQRLNGEDMHFFGIAPLQEAMEVVVCSHCAGTYTKMGLNNHMMLQHPEVWRDTPTKLASTSAEASALAANIQESTRELASAKDSTASVEAGVLNTPKSSSAGTPKQKGKSKSGSGRSRSKTKHSNANSAAGSAPTTPSKAEAQQSKSSKGHSKKSAKAAALIAANAPPATKESAHSKEAVVPIVLYSSSSNSSCSLPATPKTSAAASAIPSVEPIGIENLTTAFVPPDGKEKLTTEPIIKPKSKKKSKNIPAANIVDINATHASALPNEFERPAAGVSAHSKSSSHSSSTSRGVKGTKKRTPVMQPPVVKDSAAYEAEISEIDQAVSSITNSLLKNAPTADATGINNVIQQQQQQQQEIVPDVANYQNQMEPPMAPSADESLPPHNTSDDNSILTLEDMLDSKFINEILSTAESEINFDETELEPSNQQNFVQQPANKRMRYDDTSMMPVQQQVQQMMPGVITGEFTMYPQQAAQQEQHYAQYNSGNIVEDIKLFNNANMQQVSQMDPQYQQTMQQQQQQQSANQQNQLTPLDAMQLQQLLYQQQAYNTGSMDSATVAAMQQQQQQQEYSGICVTDGMPKNKEYDVDDKLLEYATQHEAGYEQSMAAVAAAAQFNVFNVPSLTDDLSTHASDALLPNLVNSNLPTNEAQQFVLPATNDGQVIYEITENNQVAVMSQQQVIAEFLTQAGYGAVDNVNVTQPLSDSTNLLPKSNVNTEFWDDGIDDLDYAKIETVKSVSSTNTSAADCRSIKQENALVVNANQHTKNLDDFYHSVYLYSGIPRPLTVNNFGLVKLPHSAATTFKKQLLASRKTYNNLFTVSGSSAGGVTPNSARFTATNAGKGAQNYFAATPQSSSEYLIGNITISNTPSATNNTIQQQQLVKQDGGIEITINANSATANRVRQKGTLVVPAGVASAHNKAKFVPTASTSPAAAAAALPMQAARVGGSTANAKSINVVNFGGAGGPTASSERVKFVKRPFLAKLDMPKSGTAGFSAKKLTDIINGQHKAKSSSQHVFAVPQDPPQIQHSQTHNQQHFVDAMSQDIKNSDFMSDQMKRHRMQNFFDRRQKMPNTGQQHNNSNAIGSGGTGVNALAQQPQLLKQQLMRTLSDFGVSNIAQCKVTSATNTKPNNNSNSNDLMRVFV